MMLRRLYHTFVPILGLIPALLAGCAGTGQPRPGVYTDHLADARSAMEQRDYRAAEHAIQAARTLRPTAAEPDGLLGQSRFRRADYAASERAFRAAYAKKPDDHLLLSRAWAAQLQGAGSGDEVRRGVEQSIESLVAANPRDASALLAAIRGYRYLGRGDASRALFGPLLAFDASGQYRDEIAGLLFESLLETSSTPVRLRLAGLYLKHFPQQDNAYSVARVLIQLELRGTEGSPLPRLDHWIGSPYPGAGFRQALAGALIEAGHRLDVAVTLVRENIRQRPQDSPPLNEREPVRRGAWARDWYLLGRAQQGGGDNIGAEAAYRRALELNRWHAGALHRLGGLAVAADRDSEAVDFYRRALQIRGEDQALEAELVSLLSAQGVRADGGREVFTRTLDVPVFSDHTGLAGLDGVSGHRIGWRDYDRDGRPDLLLDARLFRNTRGGFEETTRAAGLPAQTQGRFGVWADYDNDGWTDLVIVDESGVELYRNLGDAAFAPVPGAFPRPDAPWPVEAAAWGDVDNDGLLDLYLARYEIKGVELGICGSDRLYRNLGGGRFLDMTDSLLTSPDEPYCGRDVAWVDLDEDGSQEILVGNYRLDPNLLWSREQGRYADASRRYLFRGDNYQGAYGHTIGLAIGDLNGNGKADVFATNLAHPRYLEYSDLSVLLLDPGSEQMARAAFDDSGIRFEETNAVPALGDADNDGDLDLVFSSIYRGRRSRLYLNQGDAVFDDASWLSRVAVENAWDTSFVDFDRDGDLDLLFASHDGVRLLRNQSTLGHWLTFSVASVACNSEGIGTRVQIEYAGQTQVGWIGTHRRVRPVVHFGLGEYQGPVKVTARSLCGGTLTRMLAYTDRLVVLQRAGF